MEWIEKAPDKAAKVAFLTALRDITEGVGPMQSIVSLGCAGWSAGQLDREMADNIWLNLPASADLVFDHDRDTLWQHSFSALGIDPGFFAGSALGVWYMIFKARQVAQREEE